MKLFKIDKFTDTKLWFVAVLDEAKRNLNGSYTTSYAIIKEGFHTKGEAQAVMRQLEKEYKQKEFYPVGLTRTKKINKGMAGIY